MRKMIASLFALALLSKGAMAQALPDQRPILRIEPQMHTAPTRGVGHDAACSMLVTGSDDKTARIWSLPENGTEPPRLLRTLRVPIGQDSNGAIYTVAMSPDGKWTVAGGWDAEYAVDGTMYVYVFETATGKLVTRLGKATSTALRMTFSPDGTRLAAVFAGGQGLRVWSVGDWGLIKEDTDFHGKDAYGIVFDKNNTVYAVGYDGILRRYNANGRLEATARTDSGKQPHSLAIHPNGTKLAVGFVDSTGVDVYGASTLKRLYSPDTKGVNTKGFNAMAWNTDGSLLFASGAQYSGKTTPLAIWQNEGRGSRQDAYGVSNDTVMELQSCGSNIAAVSADPVLGIFSESGVKGSWQEAVTVDMREKKGSAFAVAYDGKSVRFGLELGEGTPVQFNLTDFQLRDAPHVPGGFSVPKTTGFPINGWDSGGPLTVGGRTIKLKDFERPRAIAITPDNRHVIVGTEYSLRAYNTDGTEWWPAKDSPGVAWGVNISRDGRLLIAAFGDGTIRWYRASDGKELLALFVHRDRRFVVWTPKGYYSASPGAEELIGWHLNRDWNHAADFFPASRFRDRYNRSDIVKRVLEDLDEDTAVNEANRLAPTKPEQDLKRSLPPVITIVSPSEGGTFASRSLNVKYTVRSPSGLTVSEVIALVDGRPLPGASSKGLGRVTAAAETEGTITLTNLPAHDVTVSLVARAGDIESVPSEVRLSYKGLPVAEKSLGSTVSLYALVVGVSKFKDRNVTALNYAAKDANDIATMLHKQEGGLYRKVEVKLLTDEEATNDAILDGLEWLQRSVSTGDVGVIYFSGHGISKPNGDYYYVAYNSKLEDVGGLWIPTRSSSVPDTEINRALKQITGNALFFFDTCHAGQATGGVMTRGQNDTNKLINELAGSANAVVLASSTGNELSLEREEWKNGAFTKAMLEGLAGAADYNKDGVVSIDELTLYVKTRVKELTGGLQHPVDQRPRQTQDVVIAKVK